MLFPAKQSNHMKAGRMGKRLAEFRLSPIGRLLGT